MSDSESSDDTEKQQRWLQTILDSKAVFSSICSHTFQKFDADRSGALELPEVELLVKEVSDQFGVEPPASEKVRSSFVAVDKSATNSLLPDEFPIFFEGILRGMQSQCSKALDEDVEHTAASANGSNSQAPTDKVSTWNASAPTFEPKDWTPNLTAPEFQPTGSWNAGGFQPGGDWSSSFAYNPYMPGAMPYIDPFTGIPMVLGGGFNAPVWGSGAIMGTSPTPPSTDPLANKDSARTAILAMCGAWNALREPSLPEGAVPKAILLQTLLLLSPEEAAIPDELQSLKCIKRGGRKLSS